MDPPSDRGWHDLTIRRLSVGRVHPTAAESPAGGLPRSAWRDRLIRALFPAPSSAPAHRRRTTAGYALAFLCLTAAGLSRQPGVPSTNSIWAEDGKIFYADALNRSYFDALFRPYNGYLHLVPRTEAEVATWFPIADASDVLAILAAASVAALALVVFRAAAGHLPDPLLRGFLAVAVVAVPIGTQETLNNVANLHWYLIFAAFWVLLWVPRSPAGVAVAAVVVGAAVGSDPLTWLLLPLVVLRLLGRTGRGDRLLAVVFCGVGLVQGMVAVHAPARSLAGTRPTIGQFGRSYGIRVALQSLAGKSGTESLYGAWGYGAVVAAVALLVAALGLAVARRGTAAWLAVTAAAASVLFYALTSLAGWAPAWLPQPSGLFLFVYARYTVLPILLLLTLLLAALTACPAGLVRRVASIVVVVGLAVPMVVDFRVANVRMTGPAWSTELSKARATCAARPPRGPVQIAISPRPWVTTFRCSDLH